MSATNITIGATPRRAASFMKPISSVIVEEFVEGVIAEVDDLADAVIDDQARSISAILPKVSVDLGGLCDLGQEVEQRRLLEIDVECGHAAARCSARNSVSSRDSRVLPTCGRGEQTM